MSDRSQWKMLHLLYCYGHPHLGLGELRQAGIDCYNDTIQHLIDKQAVERGASDTYQLSPAARAILETCIVANRRWSGDDMRVDYPEGFVIMPFSESWSDRLYREMIEPALIATGMSCVRGDTAVRVGDLNRNIWDSIMRAGVVIAEVSVPNPNVFYELGLAHALGKDVFILKQKDARTPADFGGAHYYEYDLDQLDDGRQRLSAELQKWADSVHATGVKQLER